eukprot:8210508-Heterocapsa_arctica.AAC.1
MAPSDSFLRGSFSNFFCILQFGFRDWCFRDLMRLCTCTGAVATASSAVWCKAFATISLSVFAAMLRFHVLLLSLHICSQ